MFKCDKGISKRQCANYRTPTRHSNSPRSSYCNYLVCLIRGSLCRKNSQFQALGQWGTIAGKRGRAPSGISDERDPGFLYLVDRPLTEKATGKQKTWNKMFRNNCRQCPFKTGCPLNAGFTIYFFIMHSIDNLQSNDET